MATAYLTFPSPGTGGINTDMPAWKISGSEATTLINGITIEGVLTQRRGWTYRVPLSITTSDTTKAIDSYSETFFSRFPRMAVVATQRNSLWTLGEDGKWGKMLSNYSPGVPPAGGSVSPPTGGDFLLGLGVLSADQYTLVAEPTTTPQTVTAQKRTTRYLPRAVYNGEVIYCATDGYYPALRFAGAYQAEESPQVFTRDGTNNIFAADKGTARLARSGSADVPNLYWSPVTRNSASASFPMDTRSANEWDIPSLKATGTTYQPDSMETHCFGVAWAACEIHEDGLVTIGANGTLTFTGPRPPANSLITVNNAPYPMMSDVIMVERQPGISWSAHPLFTETTTGSEVATTSGPVKYAILRRLGCRDVAAHGGVLFAAGNIMRPSRVWYTEPGWNLSTPPDRGTDEPYAYDGGLFYDRRAGRMRYVDVPAQDTDEIVAILTTDSPLLVLKTSAVYGIYGAYPNFTQSLLSAGAGCIDTRAAISVEGYGAFWAGPNGIYSYKRGKITDLTDKRVNSEWTRRIRAYTADKDADNCVALGVAANHLIVSATVGTGASLDQWTWACNLSTGAWTELSNCDSRFFYTTVTNAGIQAVLSAPASVAAERRPRNVMPMFFLGGSARDGDGTAPYMIYETGSATDGNEVPDRESRLTEVAVDYAMQDDTAGQSAMDVVVSSTGGLDASPTLSTANIGTVLSRTDPYTHKTRFRAGLFGRENRIRVEVKATPDSNKFIQVHDITARVRARRSEK